MKKIDARSLSPEAQEERRHQALRLREELQLTWKEIARVVGVHISTVIGWGQRYGRDGEAGLKARRRGRRYLTGRTLTLAQEGRVRSILVDETPGQRGLGFALWNRRAVMELIEALFGVAMPIRTVGEYLLRWGYTPQRPIKRALEQRPAEVQRWLDKTYPTILARAKAEKALIYWGDETAVVEDGHWVRGYAPQGKTPVLATPGRRSGLALVSAISNQGLVRFRFIEQAMNADWLIEFLGQLIADTPQKVFLILDHLKAYHAKAVTRWVGERPERIELFYLPPYTPEHNPAEYLNRDCKTHLRLSARSSTPHALRQKAETFLHVLLNTPARVIAFNHYAAQSPISSLG